MNNSELPLDPNMQACNLLITFLKYASIVMQDTKGKQGSLCSLLNKNVIFHFIFIPTHSYTYTVLF